MRSLSLNTSNFLSAVVLLVSGPVLAGDLVFYEGNGCRQDIVFEYDSARAADDNCKRGGACKGDNDEARSLYVRSGAQAGTKVYIFDNPDAKKDDDWAIIKFHPRRNVSDGVCIPSFETSARYGDVKVEYYYDNGLDGKVSHVTVEPYDDSW